MTVVGYVSNEQYVAIADCAVEFQRGDERYVARSTASGAIDVEGLAPGCYVVTLSAPGYGPKRTEATIGSAPQQFRLLPDRPFGYVWPKWAPAGSWGEPRMSSPRGFRLSLLRCGAEIEDHGVISWFDEHGPRAMAQTTPDGDYTQEGVGWNRRGYANQGFRPKVRAPERSGLFYFSMETEDGQTFTFPWVVSPARPSAPLAVLASTNTWNAYNNFGGRSNYINASGLPPVPTVVARHDLARYQEGDWSEHSSPDDEYPPLSFERPEPLNQVRVDEQPTGPIRGRQTCHLAAAEWRFLSWLEREGFAYDLYAEGQLDDGSLHLAEYRALVLSTHPEYWSRRMFERVADWVAGGGNLLYLGGNGLDCEVEFLSQDRLHFLTQDPAPDSGLDCRMHRTYRSPAELLGVTFTQAGAMSAAPYEVLIPEHWVFGGLELAAGDHIGVHSLHERCPGGASGHETDKRTGRTPSTFQLLAKGLNADQGGAELVIAEGGITGGMVFSVGSITWTASILVDQGVAAITRNVLQRALG